MKLAWVLLSVGAAMLVGAIFIHAGLADALYAASLLMIAEGGE